MTHPGDDVLMDVLDGSAEAAARAHVAECAACGQRLAAAGEALAMAEAAGAEEPSPLFFERFPAKVAAAASAVPRRRRLHWLFAPALLGTAAAVAVAMLVPQPARAPVTPGAVPLPAWTALPAVDDGMLANLDPAQAAEAAVVACPDVAECLASLDDEEWSALADALLEELEPGADL